ncbi:MAG: hypothetical protein ACI84C_001711 [Flavobacteriales bacterium]|jgi:hypothetical protein
MSIDSADIYTKPILSWSLSKYLPCAKKKCGEKQKGKWFHSDVEYGYELNEIYFR